MHTEIKITKEDLKTIIYFIIMKYKSDPLHRQGTSAKRDYIGGFIERWVNKISEVLIFRDYLLKDKDYNVVTDFFLYANDSEKNAPDIIGLKNKNKEIPFVKYYNGRWENEINMPRVEIKTVRSDQKMLAIREPQMIDDYYMFIESNFNEDYLMNLFEDSVFDEKYFNALIPNSDVYIKEDIDEQIIKPIKINKIENDFVGTIKLIGTYSKQDIKNIFSLCYGGESPYYLSDVSSHENKIRGGVDTKKSIKIENNTFIYKNNDDKYLPVSIIGTDNIFILKQNKTSLYIESEKDLTIDGKNINKGIIKLIFTKFDRSSNWEENIVTKNYISQIETDKTSELIKLFDSIIK